MFLYTAGIATLCLTLLYYIIDAKPCRTKFFNLGVNPMIVFSFGSNSKGAKPHQFKSLATAEQIKFKIYTPMKLYPLLKSRMLHWLLLYFLMPYLVCDPMGAFKTNTNFKV
jgi:hypothetical protein